MAKKIEEKVVEKVEQDEVTTVTLMPNWENTATWLMVCRQILTQKVRTPSSSALFNKVDKEPKDKVKFALIYSFAEEQIKIHEKRIETLKSISEIARYETSICMKRDD